MAIEELGATFIKFGQILSTRPDQVGMPLAQELQKLQTSVACDEPKVVRDTIESEFGQPLETLFADFDTTPLASASIGQAHRARLHGGDDVVVKVQHAGIRRRMEVDLDILGGLAQLAEKLPELQSYRPQATVAEFRRVVRREFDFAREARNLQQFAAELRPLAACANSAAVFRSFRPGRVLTMEWLDGAKLCDPAVRQDGRDRLPASHATWRGNVPGDDFSSRLLSWRSPPGQSDRVAGWGDWARWISAWSPGWTNNFAKTSKTC